MMDVFRGDVFYANLDFSIGSEQNGKRPVLVVQNDVGNKCSPTTVIVPISKQKKNQLPTHITIKKNNFMYYDSIALIEQIRVIDKNRLIKYLGKLSFEDMKLVSESIALELGIK